MFAEWPADVDLRLLLTGGDALHHHPPPGLPFTLVNNYGPTEGTVVATSVAIAPSHSARLAPSIGRPIDNVRLYVVDEGMRLCPFGQAGELLLGGELLARGYLHRPELTAEKFIVDRFSGEDGARLYRTGDLVRYRPTGELEFLGRLDQQVQIRGHRVEPGEIAATLDGHVDVLSCAVEAVADASGQKLLVAFVVPADERRPADYELRSTSGPVLARTHAARNLCLAEPAAAHRQRQGRQSGSGGADPLQPARCRRTGGNPDDGARDRSGGDDLRAARPADGGFGPELLRAGRALDFWVPS